MEAQLLTVDELARELRVKKSWVYGKSRLKGAERIPHTRVGKYCRFRLFEVLAWLEGQQEGKESGS